MTDTTLTYVCMGRQVVVTFFCRCIQNGTRRTNKLLHLDFVSGLLGFFFLKDKVSGTRLAEDFVVVFSERMRTGGEPYITAASAGNRLSIGEG